MKKILFLNLLLLLSAFSLYAQTNGNNDSAPNADTTIFQFVEWMPEPGFNLNEYLAKNMKYPKEVVSNNIEGKVYVRFVINTDGSITHPEITGRRIENGELLEKESIRVVKNMPKWKPGKQNGQPVRVRYVLPLTWKLQ